MNAYNPFSLKNKIILVTSASSGIGRATAIECSKMGAKVVITGRNAERLQETFAQLDGEGHLQIAVDLQDTFQLNALIETISEVNGIVHCAGLTKNIPFQFASRENLDEVMNVNFYAPAELSRLLIKSKKLNKESSIVFISSISGVICSAPANAIYSASKGAINGLVKAMALALDLAPKKIRVNSVCPGVIETAIFSAGVVLEEQLEENKKQYPLKRFGQPEEVAFAVIYLLSDASSFVTGSSLVIDGGFTLQ